LYLILALTYNKIMITCPWCGTSYERFLSNCKNCGGPIPAQTEDLPEMEQPGLPLPPAAPRSFSDAYTWRLLTSDGWAVASMVFAFLGAIFTMVGVALTLGIVTAFVGIPFALLGLGFLGGGAAIFYWRYQEKQKILNVLRWGETARGQVTDVQVNSSVSINGRNPWYIDYEFQVNGQTQPGRVTTLTPPIRYLAPGMPVYVLYMPAEPSQNALYPHP
jgi:hypothetical protein